MEIIEGMLMIIAGACVSVALAGSLILRQLEKIRDVMEATARHDGVPEYINKQPEESQ